MFKPCIVIPLYNHSQYIAATVVRIRACSQAAILLVDDGSDDSHKKVLAQFVASQIYNHVTLLTLAQNQGKGGAVSAGFKYAQTQGFSHVLQVDADGQHACEDIPKILTLAAQHPTTVICGIPEYDASVPKGRLYGRYVTHFWVWVETLSFAIKDSMCGFRVYPLDAVMALIQTTALGQRMDFDTEILVRLYWRGTDVVNFPTRVTYPEDGASHFRLLKDNLLISWMHTRLTFGMLLRLPMLLARNLKRWSRP
jgi:glycosyltransferase involved in cell wall biosynthesis